MQVALVIISILASIAIVACLALFAILSLVREDLATARAKTPAPRKNRFEITSRRGEPDMLVFEQLDQDFLSKVFIPLDLMDRLEALESAAKPTPIAVTGDTSLGR